MLAKLKIKRMELWRYVYNQASIQLENGVPDDVYNELGKFCYPPEVWESLRQDVLKC